MKFLPEHTFGPYLIKQVFESGGMGTVLQAHHGRWDVDVAIKVVKAENAADARFAALFEQEAETWAGIGLHPYVATCYYTQRIEGTLCLCGEFVEGGSLLDGITNRTLYQADDAAVVSRIIEVSAGFALGLGWAHKHGLIHQDVKPGNVLLTAEGTPKVADFGLARAIRADGRAAVAGMTQAYASPEQLNGARLDSFTDVWSWAVSILQMFMGGLFWNDGRVVPSVLSEFCSHHFCMPGLPQMPRRVAELLTRCFAQEPKKRPSCRELAETLDTIHQELFEEPIEFLECETVELAADSVNNRAMSLIEIGRIDEAFVLFDRLVRSRPDYFEGNINYGLIMIATGRMDWRTFKVRMAAFDSEHGDRLSELIHKAELVLKQPVGGSDKYSRLQDFPFVLARPKSGAHHHHDTARFNRLISKAAAAMNNHDFQEAKRYLIMAKDLHGFAKHPKLRDLAGRMGMG